MANRDIQPSAFPELDWSDGKRAESLIKVKNYVVIEAKNAAAWYDGKRPWTKIAARWLRGGAILLTGIAGLIPLIAKLTEAAGYKVVDPVLSAVALGIAGILIVWDRFYGFSSAWIRYMKASQQINHLQTSFVFDFAAASLGWDRPDPTTSQTDAGLALCKATITELDNIIQRETDQWIAEFQSALTQLEAAQKEVTPAKPLGAIAIKVTNGDLCEVPGWTVRVDGGTEHICIGKEFSLRDITSGIHNVAVTGTIGGAAKQSTKPVDVKDGQIAQIEFTL